MRFIKLLGPVVLLGAVSGCATRDYVDDRVAMVESREARNAQRVDQELRQLATTSSQALERASDAGVLARGRFLYDVVLTDDGTTFNSGGAELSDNVQQHLTALVEQLKEENQNVYLEIQGFTDATGAEEANERLGLQRAEAVRRFLHTQGIALARMATISYGEDMPLAPNDTAEGRANNRRVSIVVLN